MLPSLYSSMSKPSSRSLGIELPFAGELGAEHVDAHVAGPALIHLDAIGAIVVRRRCV